MQAKQHAQQHQHAQAPPRTTSKQQRKPSTTVTKSTSATPATPPPANPAAATPATQATTSPAPPAAAPATTQHPQNTTTTTAEKLSPAQAAARAKSSANPQNKPKFIRRIIAIITCSSPTHIPSPSDDSARTLSSSTTTAAGGKKSYEAGTASTLDKPATTTTAAAAQNGTAATNQDPSEKSGLKPPPGPLSIQTPSTPIKSSSLTVPTSNGPASPSPSTSSSAILTGPNAPPSPSPSAIAGGTRLPREETGDVTSGAVVPPGASYVAQGGAGPGNMFRLASAVDGVPSLGIIAAVAGTGAKEDGLPTTAPHQALLATPEPATAATATLVETEDEDEEEDDDEEDDEEEDHQQGVHMDEDEYEMSEEALEEQRLIAQGGIGIPIDEDGNPHPLLSPIIDKDEGRKCLVLDLDETLVHSSFKMIQNADFIVPVEIEGNFHNVYVIKRPGVDEFMRRMGELYEVVVFTASLSKYADPVLDMLDIHRVVRHRLFRESCFNHKGNYVKDLSQLGREIGETLILDNSPASYIFHPNNAVPISSWFNDPHDTELVDLCEFLRDLSVVDDVRTVLDGAL
ncbi:unnamed protein product [Tilletia controversa]|nr:unnamed protein product [Tilletia caries]CAD6898933.1 unnamed protein product [Tilletia controversa]CAD6899856.1 unnamed protein product [Tilletia laevis]CAD6910623.1 unnamed protein product [Tilletia controversa]CAD6927994.1 unnamed protein product [Tilletia controversa]